MEIHQVKDTIPGKVATLATIPLHWQEQVKADLKRDVALGVIKRVKELSKWCQRMVRKWDGSSRRTVDLQPLKFCKRGVGHQHASQASENRPERLVEDSDRRVEQIPQRPAAKEGPPPDDIHHPMGKVPLPPKPPRVRRRRRRLQQAFQRGPSRLPEEGEVRG